MTEPRQQPEGERTASERSAFERAESELVEFVRSIDVRAPESLHREVQALVADASRRKGRPRMGHRRSPALAYYAFAGALAVVVAGIAIAIGLSGGGNGGGGNGPFIRQASALTLGRATTAAPSENPHNSAQLAAAVEGVA